MLAHNCRCIYLDGEAADPVLALVPADRRATLIARRVPGGKAVYRFDIHLQGDNETAFFEV
jgi:protocatechuate 3,4-dioxygenase, alpha subunit